MRDRFLSHYGYSTDGYEAPGFAIHLGPLTLNTPNPGLLPYHDLHHIVTGFPSGLVGEAEVSAFELRVGCGSFFVGFLCVSSIAVGLCLQPKRIWRAWRQSRGRRGLYHSPIPLDVLLAMPLEELRQQLLIPIEGLALQGEF
jgi:hypothetical protein